jgi:hypothetical protein
MYQNDPGLEQRLSRFEAQLDRFSLALNQWQNHDRAPSTPDVDSRIRALEETLGREAHALRLMHEEPIKHMQAQAAHLQELCAKVQALLADLQSNGGVPASPPAKAAADPRTRRASARRTATNRKRPGRWQWSRRIGSAHGVLTLRIRRSQARLHHRSVEPDRRRRPPSPTAYRRRRRWLWSCSPSSSCDGSTIG